MLRRALVFTASIALTAAGIAAARAVGPIRSSPGSAAPLVVAEPASDHDPVPFPGPTAEPDPAPAPDEDTLAHTLKDQRRALFHTMETRLDLTADQLASVERIFEGSLFLGQGNPSVAHYGMTRSECRQARVAAGAHLGRESHPPCDRKNMVPVYDPEAGETPADARVCIDQYEFPNVACEYPVVHVSAREAAQLCSAVGKRLCDAHEWEGACAGAVHAPEEEYAFGQPRGASTLRHNKNREKVWAYGAHQDLAVCAMGTPKTAGCEGGGWKECGSNTYPSGAFPACVSPFGVYDQHGNAAEHMNLPLTPDELSSRGGMGSTEMKGSWFVFQRQHAHEDDCRWRAPDWHPSKVMSKESHENYHLGFRCCASVDAEDDSDR